MVRKSKCRCSSALTPGGWYSHDGKTAYSDESLARFTFPKDVVEDHLIASLHCYLPWNWDQNHSRLTDKHIEEIKSAFQKFDKYILARHMPLVIGEYGALFCDGVYSQKGEISEADKEEGAKYAKLMVEEATKRGISLLYFMGLIDKKDRERLVWSRPKTVDAIVETYYGIKAQ